MSLKQDKFTKGLMLFFLVLFVFISVIAVYGKTDKNTDKVLQNISMQKVEHTSSSQPYSEIRFHGFKITKDMVGKYVGINTYNASILVNVGNFVVYTNDVKISSETQKLKYTSSKWHFIPIKEEYVGKQMYVKVHTYEQNEKQDNTDIYIGYLGDLITGLLLKTWPSLLLNFLIFLGCIILGVIYILQMHNKIHTRPSNLWLCLGGFFLILLTNAHTLLMQLLINNDVIQYYFYYLVLYLMPLILLNYISDIFSRLDIVVEYYLIVIIDLVLLLCQITQTYTFLQSIYVYMVAVACIFAAIIIKLMRLRKKGTRTLLSILYIMLLLTIIANGAFYVTHKIMLQPFVCIQLMVILTMIVNIYYSAVTLVKDIEEIQENSIYREIALKDKLTGLYNRYAFERDVSKWTEADLENIGIVSMDINNLKYYNDNFGHLIGDKLIKEASSLISGVFTRVYRTGGDEFIAIVENDEVKVLDEKKETLVRKTIKYNKDSSNEIVIEIATGYAKYRFGDKTYEQILTRSDAEMYKHKEQLKERSVIKSVR